MSDLKPCPFCGDTYIDVHSTKGGNYVVGCNTLNCIGLYCEGKQFSNKEDAIAAWNRRQNEITSHTYPYTVTERVEQR